MFNAAMHYRVNSVGLVAEIFHIPRKGLWLETLVPGR